MFKELERIISELHAALDGQRGVKSKLDDICKSVTQFATKQDLLATQKEIMSQITDWAATEQADLDAISTTLDGVVTGIAALDALITNLQNSPGTLSAPDQAALDAIQTASTALKAKSAAIAVTPPGA
jgi:hypothetical protein